MFHIEKLIAVVAPHSCIVCETEGSLLCEWCEADAFYTVPPRCYVCYEYSIDSGTCKKCRKRSRPAHLWVVAQYEGVSKELIRRYKFARTKSAHKILATQLDQILPVLASDVVIVHIPTATSRRRQRGYDQSELVAKKLSALRGLEHRALLRRVGQSRQVGSSKKRRSEQILGSFRIKSSDSVPQKVLLVDDLLTTGATVEAATAELKRAGVKTVYACVFAQKQ